MTTDGEMSEKIGTVYLVGAGPGDPGLITLRGYELLQSCDAVVYDDLAAYELVAATPPHVERYYVGKRAGKHSRLQNETSKMLVMLVKRGLNVVRLKGGDPLVFARGGEEATYLKQAGVPYEIIPGVTAMTAVAAGTGIPLTDRRESAWVLMATGHEATSASLPVPWEEIARLKGGTVAIYMGVGRLSVIVEKLIAGGADPDISAAVVVNAYTGAQRIVRANLHKLPEQCIEQKVESPALVIIGNVVDLMEKLSWMTAGTLAGKRILVTRPREEASEICRKLRFHGGEPIPLPTIEIIPEVNRSDWEQVERIFGEKSWIIFTSKSGVTHFFDGLFMRGYDIRALGEFKVAAIGPGTADRLMQFGLKADLMPEISTVAELASKMVKAGDLIGKSGIRVRGNLSDDILEKTMENAGARVCPLTVYRTRTADWEPHWLKVVKESPPDYITFTSGSTVEGFVSIIGKEAAVDIAANSTVVSIGPSTTEVAESFGIKVDVEAVEHTLDGLVEAMVKYVISTTQPA
ncbi:uroporphyrinogen-III C-methyltransferase [bacterium]|nr:uroporphyrinogen-III C-methyltransferase [bacterium]